MRSGGEREYAIDPRLVDAAGRLILDKGFEGLSPSEAAAAAGNGVVDELPSAWDLFVAVIREDEDRFNAIVDSATAGAEKAGAKLLGVIETCVTDYDWSYWIELWSLATRDQRARELREDLDRPFRSKIEALVEEGRASGEFDADVEPASTALAIATLIDALAVEVTLGDDTVSPNYMLGATASVASRLLGAELKLRGRDDV
jgi:BetI-type transcriptional repressor, C-terminal